MLKKVNVQFTIDLFIENLCQDIFPNINIIVQALAMLCNRPFFIFTKNSYKVFNNLSNDVKKIPLCLICDVEEFIPCLFIKIDGSCLSEFNRIPIEYEYKDDTIYTEKVCCFF